MILLEKLPAIIMVEFFVASIVCLADRQWGPALYWFAGGMLNFAVIYLIPRGI